MDTSPPAVSPQRSSTFLHTALETLPPAYRPLLSDSFVYGVASAFSRFFSILVTPIVTRALSPTEYGVIDTITVTTALLPTVMSLNLESALLRYFYDTEPGPEQRQLISTLFAVVGFLTLLVGGICLAGTHLLGRALFQHSAFNFAISLSICATGLQLVSSIFIWILRLQRRMRDFLVCNLCSVIPNIALIFLLIFVFRLGVMGFFFASLFSNLIQCALAFRLVRHELASHFSRHLLQRCLRFSLPLVPTVFFSNLLPFLGRSLLLAFATLTEVGLFGVATKISALSLIALGPFQMAWQPFSMSVMRRPDAQTIYVNVTRYAVLILSLMMNVVIFFAPEMTAFIAGSSYANAAPILRFLVPGFVIGQLVLFFHIAITISEKPVFLFYSNVISVTVYLLAGATLTRELSVIGTAIAFVCANAALSGSTYVFAQRTNHIAFPVFRIGFVILMGLSWAVILSIATFGWFMRLSALLMTSAITVVIMSAGRGSLPRPFGRLNTFKLRRRK